MDIKQFLTQYFYPDNVFVNRKFTPKEVMQFAQAYHDHLEQARHQQAVDWVNGKVDEGKKILEEHRNNN